RIKRELAWGRANRENPAPCFPVTLFAGTSHSMTGVRQQNRPPGRAHSHTPAREDAGAPLVGFNSQRPSGCRTSGRARFWSRYIYRKKVAHEIRHEYKSENTRESLGLGQRTGRGTRRGN